MPNGSNQVKIGMWGGSGSGKTTFLSALELATTTNDTGSWNIWPQDDISPGSMEFLLNGTKALMSGSFPPPTTGRSNAYTYDINGDLTLGLLNKLRGIAGRPRHISLTLNVYDYPGGDLLKLDAADDLWGRLADCDGLVYLFDPHQKDGVERDSFECLSRSMMMMYQVLNRTNRGRLVNGLLPHHLAVCINQFDDDEIFSTLREKNLIAQDPGTPELMPYVTDTVKAFECFADRFTIPRIQRSFRKERVRFFATSSIGFYQENGKVDINRCSNISKEVGGSKILGDPVPIGVIEPLLWIHNQLV